MGQGDQRRPGVRSGYAGQSDENALSGSLFLPRSAGRVKPLRPFFEHMQEGDRIDFEGLLGRFTLRQSEWPILFIDGATGFAPVKSIVEDAFHRGIKRPMRLYWGARKREDL